MRTTMLAFAFTTVLAQAPIARADAIPGDDACHRWEHWEGAHSGRCTFGPRCSVSPALGSSHDASASTRALLGLAGVALLLRRARSG